MLHNNILDDRINSSISLVYYNNCRYCIYVVVKSVDLLIVG